MKIISERGPDTYYSTKTDYTRINAPGTEYRKTCPRCGTEFSFQRNELSFNRSGRLIKRSMAYFGARAVFNPDEHPLPEGAPMPEGYEYVSAFGEGTYEYNISVNCPSCGTNCINYKEQLDMTPLQNRYVEDGQILTKLADNLDSRLEHMRVIPKKEQKQRDRALRREQRREDRYIRRWGVPDDGDDGE